MTELPSTFAAAAQEYRAAPQKPVARRSVRHAKATPDEIGQHCRAAYLQDRLGEIVTQAAVAQWLFSVEADDDALVAFEALVGNVREATATARVFRDVHATRAQASHRAAIAAHESEGAK